MAMNTHLVKRGGRYYMRRRIPTDLLPHYDGRKEIQRALGTSDPKEAAQRVRRAGADLDDEFEAARSAALAIQKAQRPPEVRYDRSLSVPLEDVEAGEDDPANELRDEVEAERAEAKKARAAANFSRLTAAIQAAIMGAGYTTHMAPASLPATVAPAIPQQPTVASPSTAGGARSLEVLVRKWALERKPTALSEQAMRRAVQRFRDLLGDVAVPAIDKAQVVDFKDKLLADGLSARNVNYSLTQLSVLLKYGVAQAWRKDNPVTGVTLRAEVSADKARIAFPEDTLKTIFASPIYSEGHRPKAGAGDAAYWLPLLGLYTGARIEELCQLHPTKDVKEETYRDAMGQPAKCWVLLITDEGEGQSLKNSGSRRRIPIHAELLRLGFIAYVQSQKGKESLFPSLRINASGRKSAEWSKWWHTYLRNKSGVTDTRLVFHSFRHTFKDVCRECGIDKGVRDALQGHSEGGAAGGYGGEFYPLRPLVEAMDKYHVHGVKLPS